MDFTRWTSNWYAFCYIGFIFSIKTWLRASICLPYIESFQELSFPFYSNSHVTQTRAFLKTLTLPALLVMMLMMHDREVLIPVSVCACSLDFKSELSYCSKYLYKKTSKLTTIFVFILYYYYDSYYKYQYCFKKHIDYSPFYLESYFFTSRALYRFT